MVQPRWEPYPLAGRRGLLLPAVLAILALVLVASNGFNDLPSVFIGLALGSLCGRWLAGKLRAMLPDRGMFPAPRAVHAASILSGLLLLLFMIADLKWLFVMQISAIAGSVSVVVLAAAADIRR